MNTVVYRPRSGKVRLVAPYKENTRQWLKSIGIARPVWDENKKRWLVSRKYLHLLVDAAAARYGEVDIYTEHNVQERCHMQCQQAKGVECLCSCLGTHHGGGVPVMGWTQLGDVLISTEVVRAHWRITK